MRNPNRLVGVVLLVVLSLGVVWWSYLDSRSSSSRGPSSSVRPVLDKASSARLSADVGRSESRAQSIVQQPSTNAGISRSVAPRSAIQSFKEWAATYAKADFGQRASLSKEGR